MRIIESNFLRNSSLCHLVLIRKQNKKFQLVLLDHGLYQTLEQKDRIALSYFWKAIVLNDQKDMQKYAKELCVMDYEMLAEILTQAPLRSRNFRLKTKLTDEDLKYMTEFARKRFDKIMRTLKDMPRSLLLVVRSVLFKVKVKKIRGYDSSTSDSYF